MSSLADIVREALGEERLTVASVDAAFQSRASARAFTRAVRNGYVEGRGANDLPFKRPGEFRPDLGALQSHSVFPDDHYPYLDLRGYFDDRQDRHFAVGNFMTSLEGLNCDTASRMLLYCHSVTTVDPLHALPHIRTSSLWGLEESSNGGQVFAEVVRRVVELAPYEDSGLLFYTAPTGAYRTSRSRITLRAPGHEQEVTLPLDARLDLEAMRSYLDLWHALYRSSLFDGRVDLMINDMEQERLLGRVLLEAGAQPMLTTDSRARTEFMQSLLRLPLPSSKSVSNVSTTDMVTIRSSDLFENWRVDLEKALSTFDVQLQTLGSARARHNLTNWMSQRGAEVSAKAPKRLARQRLVELGGSMGLGLVGAASALAFTTHDAAVAAGTAAAMAGGASATTLARWVLGWLRGETDGATSLDAHYRTFARIE